MTKMQKKYIALTVKPAIWTALCLWLLTAAAHAEPKKTLPVGADAWCPINCTQDDQQQGISIDLARQVFEPLGYEVKYVLMPWSQALAESKARAEAYDRGIDALKKEGTLRKLYEPYGMKP